MSDKKNLLESEFSFGINKNKKKIRKVNGSSSPSSYELMDHHTEKVIDDTRELISTKVEKNLNTFYKEHYLDFQRNNPNLIRRIAMSTKRVIALCTLKSMGWRVEGLSLDLLDKAVVIYAPHTSAKEGAVAASLAYLYGVNIKMIEKKDLFNNFFVRQVLNFFDFIPIDRSGNKGVVSKLEDELNKEKHIYIVLTPQGSRGTKDNLKEKWHSGYHVIARNYNLPIVLVAADFQKKIIYPFSIFHPTDDMVKDKEVMDEHFRKFLPVKPECSYLHAEEWGKDKALEE